jgi:hypothetical protein
MRTTKTVSISMTAAERKTAERLARQTNRSVSGLLREGLKRLQEEEYWRQVQAFAGPKAKARGITEADVTRLVHEYRREKRAKRNRGRKPR